MFYRNVYGLSWTSGLVDARRRRRRLPVIMWSTHVCHIVTPNARLVHADDSNMEQLDTFQASYLRAVRLCVGLSVDVSVDAAAVAAADRYRCCVSVSQRFGARCTPTGWPITQPELYTCWMKSPLVRSVVDLLYSSSFWQVCWPTFQQFWLHLMTIWMF